MKLGVLTIFRSHVINNIFFSYIGVTLGKYQDHAVEPYNRPKELRKKDQEQHRALTKGGPFKLNLYPKTLFNPNVFKSDRPMPPPKPSEPKGPNVKPFKHSSPAKHIGGCKGQSSKLAKSYFLPKFRLLTKNFAGSKFPNIIVCFRSPQSFCDSPLG